jgi:hypothetical protein
MPDRLLVEGVDGRIGVSLRPIAEILFGHDVHLGPERGAVAVGVNVAAVARNL